MKLNVAVIFGGRSCEHDVSVITGIQLMDNADTEKYNMIPVYIDGGGVWYTGEPLRDINFMKRFNAADKRVSRVALTPDPTVKALIELKRGGMFSKAKSWRIDAVIPALHGVNGEDGSIQGLLELSDIPYTSCGVLSSSVGMDKIIMKDVFMANGFPVLPSRYYDRGSWRSRQEELLEDAEKALGYPVFVKPSNLGSSIGISRADNREQLKAAMDTAFEFDRRVLVEKGLDKPKEVNCSAMGFMDEVAVSVCEMPVSWDKFLSFGDKYLRGGKGEAGMAALQRQIPAPIPDDMTAQIQSLTKQVFKALDCCGVVRIDYLIDEDDNVFIGEINTQPGSFSFYLWEPTGLSYSALIDKLITLAFDANKEKNQSSYAFESDILAKAYTGSKASGMKTGKKV
ncbi:MAG: D-alanine--D-alanine ligase family protein [Christensenellales bacterium]|jgi:D-alanine-D-alanine ligase